MAHFEEIAHLQDREITPGERWVYSADFNISLQGQALRSTSRIDVEVADARHILKGGGRVLFLAHQGRYKDSDTEDLDYVVPYLREVLGVEVCYFPENATPGAEEFSRQIRPGTAAVMGNTRKHPGEEQNDPSLAQRFSLLGDYAAIGGFGKAHRAHASNVGILSHLPGYITESQLREMECLAPWAGAQEEEFFLAVLGGTKREKITIGLDGFLQTYDGIIPGGIVLNTILKVKGYAIGDSLIEDSGRAFERETKEMLQRENRGTIYLPERVIIAGRNGEQFSDVRLVGIDEGVPEGSMIVDYVLPPTALASLERMVAERGRLLLAGTPGIVTAGFSQATQPLIEMMRRNKDKCIVVGGDSAAELGYDGPTSVGGGSALYFVAHGTTPIIDALLLNRRLFST